MIRRSTVLNSEEEMPLLGLGTYKLNPDNGETEYAIKTAVQAGYRLIDTASAYKNEDAVGRGIAYCGVPREELFITTKIWNAAQRLGDISGACERSMDRLGLDYLDMYMVHWPVSGCYLNTWGEMVKLVQSGKVLSIGVCNYEIHHLEELRKVSGIVPAVNQIEFHPYRYRKELVDYCQDRGIQVQAYAPLARGAYLDDDIMCILATKYAKTPAQIGLRWALQKGVAVIPKSSDKNRILTNSDIFSFEIMEEDMAIIDTLNINLRTSGIPEDMRETYFEKL